MADGDELLAPRRRLGLVQVVGGLRKELLDVLRQPRLVAVLVVGPFVILMLFGLGYDEDAAALRTLFVGPEGSIYEEAVAAYGDALEDYVDPRGFTTDVLGAQRMIESGEVDLVVQFPSDASERLLRGDRAIINVFHEELDPIRQTSVEVAATLAVFELNAELLEQLLRTVTGGELRPVDEGVAAVDERVRAISEAAAAGDVEEAREAAAELEVALEDVETVTASSAVLARQLGAEVTDEQQAEIDALTDTTSRMADVAGRIRAVDDDLTQLRVEAARLEEDRDILQEQGEGVLTLDPAVLTRPFRSDSENLQREPIELGEFFAPNAVALLLGHLALTIAAMGLVRGEALGLFEVYRVGPMGTTSILSSTYLSYVLFGLVVAVGLIASLVLGIGVPLRGQPAWLVPGLTLLLAASIGLGLVAGLLARSDSQAVQMSMLALLAGLFFSGFFIDLDLLRYPVKAVSWGLPVTYGIRLLQDVMLRGDAPALLDWLGLGATTLVYGTVAAVLLHRRLRIRPVEAS